MKKPIKMLTSAVVAAVFLSASPAWADHQGTPAYNTVVYSDSSRTTEVGQIYWEGCSLWDNPQYGVYGSDQGYREVHYAGYCLGGEMRLHWEG